MIKPTPLVDPVLDDITRTIVDGFQPSRIILFGSRARGDSRDDSDYDLMIELSSAQPFHETREHIWNAIRVVGGEHEVDIKLRQPGEFEHRRNDPGTIDFDVARAGVVLYPPEARGPIPPEPLRVREPRPGGPESVAVWLARADEDLEAIELLLGGKRVPWMAASFHAQQAAEKYLKALLISKWVKPPRTHKLLELVVRARKAGCALPDLSVECRMLEPYGVDVRYPEHEPIPTDANGPELVQASRRIVDAVRASL